MKTRPTGQVRIIAGTLRGSKLPVADRPGLRPTSDRVRETLFNWLQPMLPGARVLDLFAGTGALGFEAASRGAARVLMVERDPALVASLREQAARLKTGAVQVVHADALAWLRDAPGEAFDGVFLDPPFDAGLWAPAAAGLPRWLAPSAWIYVECPARAGFSPPPDWHPYRSGRTRDVDYTVFRTTDGPAGGSAATLPGDLGPQDDSPA